MHNSTQLRNALHILMGRAKVERNEIIREELRSAAARVAIRVVEQRLHELELVRIRDTTPGGM